MKKKLLIIILFMICLTGCEKSKEIPPNEIVYKRCYPEQNHWDYQSIWNSDVSMRIPYRYTDLVPAYDLEKYQSQFIMFSRTGTKSYNEYTLMDIIKEFHIPKEEFIRVNAIDPRFSDEEIDILYSDDYEKQLYTFRNHRAFYHNKKVYPPKWFMEHSVEDYKKEGFTKEGIEAIIELWKHFNYDFKGCVFESYHLYYEIPNKEIIDKKFEQFLGT